MKIRTNAMLRSLASAVALRYDGVNAPRLTAKGSGAVAHQILQLAHKHNIPLHEDPELLELLSRLELGDEIPHALYVAIAEVIAFAYLVSGKFPDNFNNTQALKPNTLDKLPD